ncbi:MAG TPA: amidohydrolase family protein, partial [Anaeromyxobacteraceae bacterium]|nr:amidohydrolase family protein [Anaeromyxobacteraceae bacterium]
AAGRLVVPGGVDAHCHLAVGQLLRLAGLPPRLWHTVSEMRSRFRAPLEARLDPAALESLAAAGALAALRAGVTCVLDLSRGEPGREDEVLPAVARGVGRVGLRAALAYGANDLGGEHHGLAAARAGAAFAREVAGDRLLRGMAGLDGLAATGPRTLAALAGPASEVGLHASVAEDDADLAYAYEAASLRPVPYLAQSGLLGPRTVVAHGSTFGGDEAALLSRAGACLAVAPRAAFCSGSLLPPLDSLAVHDVSMAIGTDGLYPDLAGEALALEMALRRTRSQAPFFSELLGHVLWPGGAAAASRLWGEPVGTIAPGALADLVVLEWRPPFPVPEASEGDSALLWAGAPAAWAIVDGAVRLREARFLGVDEAEIAARAGEAAARVLRS